jgi:hypothetical protein
MTDVTALEAYAGQLSEAASKSTAASAKQHLYINGDKLTDVVTESGPVPTIAKQVVLAQDKVSAALIDVAQQMAGAMTYTTTVAGLAGTVNGGYFSVPSPDNNEYLILYQNTAGVAVEKKRYPSVTALSNVTSLVQPYTSTSAEVEFLTVLDDESARIASLTERRLSTIPFDVVSEDSTVMIGDSEGAVALFMDDERLMVGPLEIQNTAIDGIFVTDDEGGLFQSLSEQSKTASGQGDPSFFDGGLLFQPVIAVSEASGAFIYPQNILPRREQSSTVLATLASTSTPEVGSGSAIPINKAYGASAILNLRAVSAPGERRLLTLDIKKIAVQAPVVPVRILFIGDSIGNRQGLYLLNAYLVALGFAPTFIGTLKSSSAVNAGNDDLGPLGEAREGWESGDFTYSITDRVQIVAPGGEAAYMALPKGGKWLANPFLREAVAADPVEVVRNGYVFDCKYYQERFGFGVPDIVINALGTNDIRDRTEATVYDHVYKNDILIHTQILKAWPNAKIVRTLPGTAISAERNIIWTSHYTKTIRAMQKAAKDFASIKLSIAPLWAMANPDAGYMLPTGVGDDGFLMGDWGDPVHPLGAARFGYYSAMAPFIAAAALNII